MKPLAQRPTMPGRWRPKAKQEASDWACSASPTGAHRRVIGQPVGGVMSSECVYCGVRREYGDPDTPLAGRDFNGHEKRVPGHNVALTGKDPDYMNRALEGPQLTRRKS